MAELSLMTLNILLSILGIYKIGGDREVLEENYEEMLDVIKQAGYSAVDVVAFELSVFGEDYVKTQLAKRGIKVSSYIYFDKFALDENGISERVENAKKAVDTALRLGTKILMLVPDVHDGIEKLTPNQIRGNMISHWIPIAAYAVENGIHPVIEDTPDLRLCLCKADEVKEVLDSVPGLELVYDSGNMIFDGEDPVEYAKAFAGRIGFVHLKDISKAKEDRPGGERMRDGTPMQTVLAGTGQVDIKSVVKLLIENGYQGGMTVEFVKHPDKSYLDSLIESKKYVESCMR